LLITILMWRPFGGNSFCNNRRPFQPLHAT
jgi:hypothetical protein